MFEDIGIFKKFQLQMSLIKEPSGKFYETANSKIEIPLVALTAE